MNMTPDREPRHITKRFGFFRKKAEQKQIVDHPLGLLISGKLGELLFRESLAKGEDIVIPSLGIIIEADNKQKKAKN